MSKLEFCKKCTKRKFDPKQGIVCGLTDEKPTFKDSCSDLETDESVKEHKGVELKSNTQRAKTLLLFIRIVLGLNVISLISSGLEYNLLQTLSSGGEITNEVATANSLRELGIAIIYLIAYIISAIVFIMWFRRAYFNLHQRVKHLSFTEGWAAGSWFVPILNLYRPFQIMKELYVETKKYILENNNTSQIDLSTKFLGFWWALWIINGILGRIAFKLSRQADTLPELLTINTLSIMTGFLGVASAIVTIRVVKDYSKIEGLLISKE